MKKRISLILSLAMLLTVCNTFFTAYGETNTFSDVPAEHWAYNEIKYFYNAGIVSGVGDNLFSPNTNVTREQFAKLLSIIFAKSDYKAQEQTFSDVTPDMWSYDSIEAVKEYLTGYYPQNTKPFFNPTATASREDIAYALVQITGMHKKGLQDLDVFAKFTDSNEISPTLKEYVGIAMENGLIQGYEGKFRPQDGITRAETVVLLFKSLKSPVVSPESTSTPEPSSTTNPEKQDYTYNIISTNIDRIAGYENGAVTGTIELNWSPNENKAEFLADLKCNNGGLGDYVNCKIELIDLTACGETKIEGYFKVSLSGTVRDENIRGILSVANGTINLNTEEYDYNLVAKYDKSNTVNDPDTHPVKSQNKIYSTDIFEFKISNLEGENIDISDPKRLKGSMELYFGVDAIADTKFIANVVVDGKDEYLISSTSIYRYSNGSYATVIELNYDVYKNGKLIIKDQGFRTVLDKENDEFLLQGKAKMTAYGIVWSDKKLPPVPKNQPYEIWDNSKSIMTNITAFNGKEAEGFMGVQLSNDKKDAKLSTMITVDGSIYVVAIEKVTSITSSQIEAIFNITCDGKSVASDVSGKITDIGSDLGETISFATDDGKWKIEMRIVEISN